VLRSRGLELQDSESARDRSFIIERTIWKVRLGRGGFESQFCLEHFFVFFQAFVVIVRCYNRDAVRTDCPIEGEEESIKIKRRLFVFVVCPRMWKVVVS